MNNNKVQLLNVELEKHTLGVWTILFYIISFMGSLYLVYRIYSCCKPKSRGELQYEVNFTKRFDPTPRHHLVEVENLLNIGNAISKPNVECAIPKSSKTERLIKPIEKPFQSKLCMTNRV